MTDVRSFEEVVRRRRTEKVFADPAAPPAIPEDLIEDVWTAAADAGWAPFHYPSHKSHHASLGSAVPWRFHVLDHNACRDLVAQLEGLAVTHADNPTLAAAMNGKIPAMLAAAGGLVLVTWLPHPTKGDAVNEKLVQMNQEHQFAAAAATQTLLLSLTARGRRTYWSSGGALATRPVFDALGIGDGEQFVAAVFVWPDEFDGEESVPGKHRESRGEVADFARRVSLS